MPKEDPKKEDAKIAEAPVTDSEGNETNPASEELGARQVQAKLDAAEESGTFPGTGGPPATDHTVAAVTGNTALQELADKGAPETPPSKSEG